MTITKPSPAGSAPWERQQGESSQAYSAFRHFLDAGELRQLKSTASAMERSTRLIEKWAHNYRWHDRVLAWDQFTSRLDAAERRQKIAAMRRKHAGLAADLLQKVGEAIKTLDADDLSAGNIIKMLEKGTAVERLALEEPTHAASQPTAAEVNVTIDQRQVNIDVDRAELATYLDAHPEKIPQVVAIVEKLLNQPPELPSREEKDVTPAG